jgi:hypothetical protein
MRSAGERMSTALLNWIEHLAVVAVGARLFYSAFPEPEPHEG